jgi:isocitrate dehydrogenase (NAD+)
MAPRTVTVIPGDGTGPELMAETKRVLLASGASLAFEEVEAGEPAIAKYGNPLPDQLIASLKKNKLGIKGPITTPIGTGYRSINVGIRKALDLWVNVRPCEYMPGVATPIPNVNLTVIRENTEDLYAGIEKKISDDEAHSIKVITRKASERVAHFAFQYARKKGLKKVTIVHKANIMKLSDGLWLETCRNVGKNYSDIETEDRIVDNMCMQLVQKPQLYQILLCPNMYGDIISDLCAGLIGGLGVAPAGNIGDGIACFEAVHGSAPKYKGMNKVNPTALILTGAMMLEYMGEVSAAERIRASVKKVIAEKKKVTYDLGGTAKTSEMADEIIRVMKSL